MAFEDTWRRLREAATGLGPDTVLVTPASERAFTVRSVEDDRIVVAYVDDGERRLRRDQFAVLSDRLADGAMPVGDLPSGVEPYVALFSLLPGHELADGALRRTASVPGGESPLLRPAWTARRPPERVHDDAVLLADLLSRLDAGALDLATVPDERLTDLYVLLSDVQRGADGLRSEAGDALLEHVGPEGRLHGRYGTVTRVTRERRRPRDDETILTALDAADVPREWVLGVDPEKLDVVLAATDLEESAVYEVEEQTYVQKTAVAEDEKQARLQGLRARLSDLEGEEGEALREEIRDLEERIEAAVVD